MRETIKKTGARSESGNALVIVLVLLMVAAVGAGAYFSGSFIQNDNEAHAAQDVAQGETAQASAETQIAQAANNVAPAAAGDEPQNTTEPFEVRDGNPVIAKLNGTEIKRVELLRFIRQLPPQFQQQPIEKLYPYALSKFLDNQILSEKVAKAKKLDKDPAVIEQTKAAKENIKRGVYMQKAVTDAITDERIQKEYDLYKSNFKSQPEISITQILVAEEKQAKELIKKIEAGETFEELAKAHSIHTTAQSGGKLPGFFQKGDVDESFAEAAFKLGEGEFTKNPVKTQFGYHIVRIDEKRDSVPVSFEEAKPQIVVQLRPMVLEEVLVEWRKTANVEAFDINGDPLPPLEPAN